MNPSLAYPSPDEVETADRDQLRYWLNNLPGDGGDNDK